MIDYQRVKWYHDSDLISSIFMLTGLLGNPIELLFWLAALLVAVTVHEFMHAWTANYLGDPTARMQGRISLNPLAHLDFLGTLAILLIGFGWGKPVQVNPNNFKNYKVGWAVVSFAGPLANLVTAAFLSIPLVFFSTSLNLLFTELLTTVIYLNIILMVFNLIPIPPLDGSKILFAFFPDSIDVRKVEAYGPILLIAVFFFGRGLLSGIIGPVSCSVFSLLEVDSLMQMFRFINCA